MATIPTHSGHSADVQIRLISGGQSYRVAKVGPERLYLRDALEVAATDARLIVTIDGVESQWLLHLPAGAMKDEPRVTFQVLRFPPSRVEMEPSNTNS